MQTYGNIFPHISLKIEKFLKNVATVLSLWMFLFFSLPLLFVSSVLPTHLCVGNQDIQVIPAGGIFCASLPGILSVPVLI